MVIVFPYAPPVGSPEMVGRVSEIYHGLKTSTLTSLVSLSGVVPAVHTLPSCNNSDTWWYILGTVAAGQTVQVSVTGSNISGYGTGDWFVFRLPPNITICPVGRITGPICFLAYCIDWTLRLLSPMVPLGAAISAVLVAGSAA